MTFAYTRIALHLICILIMLYVHISTRNLIFTLFHFLLPLPALRQLNKHKHTHTPNLRANSYICVAQTKPARAYRTCLVQCSVSPEPNAYEMHVRVCIFVPCAHISLCHCQALEHTQPSRSPRTTLASKHSFQTYIHNYVRTLLPNPKTPQEHNIYIYSIYANRVKCSY